MELFDDKLFSYTHRSVLPILYGVRAYKSHRTDVIKSFLISGRNPHKSWHVFTRFVNNPFVRFFFFSFNLTTVKKKKNTFVYESRATIVEIVGIIGGKAHPGQKETMYDNTSLGRVRAAVGRSPSTHILNYYYHYYRFIFSLLFFFCCCLIERSCRVRSWW